MTTHFGLLTLVDSASDEDRRAIVKGLLGLVGEIDGLVRAQVGTDLGLREGNGDILFRLDFSSQEAWRTYGAHPAHQRLLADAISPVLKAKAFVQVAELETAEL